MSSISARGGRFFRFVQGRRRLLSSMAAGLVLLAFLPGSMRPTAKPSFASTPKCCIITTCLLWDPPIQGRQYWVTQLFRLRVQLASTSLPFFGSI